jgi:hypothetical protein
VLKFIKNLRCALGVHDTFWVTVVQDEEKVKLGGYCDWCGKILEKVKWFAPFWSRKKK